MLLLVGEIMGKCISEMELTGLGNLAKSLVSGGEEGRMKSERDVLDIRLFYQTVH